MACNYFCNLFHFLELRNPLMGFVIRFYPTTRLGETINDDGFGCSGLLDLFLEFVFHCPISFGY